MKVVIDISPLRSAHKTRGIGMYTKYLVRALRGLKTEDKFVLTSKPSSHNADVIHYPFFDFFSLTLPPVRKAKTIVTIHDAIPLVFPDKYYPGIRGKVKFLIQKMLLKSIDFVIADSENTKKDVSEFLGFSSNVIETVHLAASKDFRPTSETEKQRVRKKYGLPKKFVLYVGDINYNKNLPALIRAFSQFREIELVLVTRALKDKNLPESKEIFETIVRHGLSEKIKILTSVPTESVKDLRAVYSCAFLYIQPSLYEGFGMPVLEAMACGVPVVSSDKSSLPEVGGEAAIYFNPSKGSSIKKGLEKGLNLSKHKREELVLRGYKQAKKFSWKKTAKNTLDIYRMVNDEAIG